MELDDKLRASRSLAAPLYAVAALLVVTPLTQLAASLGWRVMPGSMQWRTGALGLLASAILTPTLGMLVAVLTAVVYEHRLARRILPLLCGLAALGLLALLGVFILDGLQMRAVLTARFRPQFTNSLIQGAVVYALNAAALATICVGALRVDRRARRIARATQRSRRPEDPLLVSPAAEKLATNHPNA